MVLTAGNVFSILSLSLTLFDISFKYIYIIVYNKNCKCVCVWVDLEGLVKLWDIRTGRPLRSFNLTHYSAEAAICEGNFTPDGSSFCLLNQYGRLLLFGTGSLKRYRIAPEEQFFEAGFLIPTIKLNNNNKESSKI